MFVTSTSPINATATSTANSSEVVQKITQLINQAHAIEGDNQVNRRREGYEAAFTVVRSAVQAGVPFSDLHIPFAKLLHAYASDTCYGQVSKAKDAEGKPLDKSEGFRRCSRIMELSLMQQLSALGFLPTCQFCKDSFEGIDSLEHLIDALDYDANSNLADLDDALRQLTPSQLDDALPIDGEKRTVLSDTLIKLTFAHANTPAHGNVPNLRTDPRQKLFQIFSEKIIGSHTYEQRATQVEFAYNRCATMVEFGTHASKDELLRAQIASYGPVLQLAEEVHGKTSDVYLGKVSQVANMRAILSLQLTDADKVEKAADHVRHALNVRLSISEPTNSSEKWVYNFLLSNLRTVLVTVLAKTPGLPQECKDEANLHLDAIEKFMLESQAQGIDHNYFAESYIPLLTKARPMMQ